MEVTFAGAPKFTCIQHSPFEAENEKGDISYPDSSFSLREEMQSNVYENSLVEGQNKNKIENDNLNVKSLEIVDADNQNQRKIKLISIYEEKVSKRY